MMDGENSVPNRNKKGKAEMAIAPDQLPMVRPADHIQGPGQGRWTYKDYAALPDDGRRYEIVDGVLFMAPSPGRSHQKAAGKLYKLLSSYIEDMGLGEVYIAPFDVELADDVTVQPDVMVILNDHLERITDNRIIGAPDLVIEVLSPGSAGYDRREKQNSYTRAGVPEYWIVDPAAHTVEVLTLEFNEYSSQGVFQGKAILPTKVIPAFPVHVEQFFAW
jgi:Uma2 family endonuclease